MELSKTEKLHNETFRRIFRKRKIDSKGCWIFTGHLNQGYGRVTMYPKKSKLVHRISWELLRGDIPEGLVVCHKCDVTSCFNPRHLFLGTNKENTMDASKKGRMTRGEKVHFSKLKESDILEIRRLSESTTQVKIAKIYGVTQALISEIVMKKIWKHI